MYTFTVYACVDTVVLRPTLTPQASIVPRYIKPSVNPKQKGTKITLRLDRFLENVYYTQEFYFTLYVVTSKRRRDITHKQSCNIRCVRNESDALLYSTRTQLMPTPKFVQSYIMYLYILQFCRYLYA